jgi:hypothetical protein
MGGARWRPTWALAPLHLTKLECHRRPLLRSQPTARAGRVHYGIAR